MNTKEKIITTFYTLVSEKGYEKASMNDIVKTAGVSKGAIYHHFRGKEELFLEAVAFIFTQGDEKLIDTSIITKENYIDVLKQTGLMFFQNFKEQEHYSKFFYEFLMASIRYESIKVAMRDVFAKYFEILETVFFDLKEKDIIPKNSNYILMAQKFFIFLDALSLYQTYELDLDYEALWNSFIDQLFK